MSRHGADTEQLTALGNTLKQQMGPIDSLISTVTSALANTTWEGPARQQFEEEWNSSFRTTLDRLKAAFEAAGNGCIRRSTDLAIVMGAH